jgi:hypothetical protein
MTFDVVVGVIFVDVMTCTTVPGVAASSLPMAKLVPIAGIVAVVSSPSVPATVSSRPGWPSLKTTAAAAPAACAFSTFWANGHVPRCMSATLPAVKPAKSAASQPEVLLFAAAPGGSTTSIGWSAAVTSPEPE